MSKEQSENRRTEGSITVIGGGLAGSEAAFQIARRGIKVRLYEMRPTQESPAHKTDKLAELVCSNSLGSIRHSSGSGLLKTEMEKLGSLIVKAAQETAVPAGQALAVDRDKFSDMIQSTLESMPEVEIIREEITEIPKDGIVIIASGPLTSPPLAEDIQNLLGEDYLYFYDAVSPTVYADSINMDIAFFASRYGKGTDDYLNCPMSKEEYDRFYEALTTAERVSPHDFEKKYLFDGCMPIEEMADRGRKTLLFGPLKPVGLKDDAAAVVQLRKENREGTLFNLVGFQTRLKWGEQKRVLRMIPGLEKAEIARYGVMHKNIYVHSPTLLKEDLSLQKDERIYLAGQITGVEGYMESTAMGMLAGINAARKLQNKPPAIPPRETMLGSLIDYITDKERKKFQPINSNFGILPVLKIKKRKRERRDAQVERALEVVEEWVKVEMEVVDI